MGLIDQLLERWFRYKYRQSFINDHFISLSDVNISLRGDEKFMSNPSNRVFLDIIAGIYIHKAILAGILASNEHGSSLLIARGQIITRHFLDEQLGITKWLIVQQIARRLTAQGTFLLR